VCARRFSRRDRDAGHMAGDIHRMSRIETHPARSARRRFERDGAAGRMAVRKPMGGSRLSFAFFRAFFTAYLLGGSSPWRWRKEWAVVWGGFHRPGLPPARSADVAASSRWSRPHFWVVEPPDRRCGWRAPPRGRGPHGSGCTPRFAFTSVFCGRRALLASLVWAAIRARGRCSWSTGVSGTGNRGISARDAAGAKLRMRAVGRAPLGLLQHADSSSGGLLRSDPGAGLTVNARPPSLHGHRPAVGGSTGPESSIYEAILHIFRATSCNMSLSGARRRTSSGCLCEKNAGSGGPDLICIHGATMVRPPPTTPRAVGFPGRSGEAAGAAHGRGSRRSREPRPRRRRPDTVAAALQPPHGAPSPVLRGTGRGSRTVTRGTRFGSPLGFGPRRTWGPGLGAARSFPEHTRRRARGRAAPHDATVCRSLTHSSRNASRNAGAQRPADPSVVLAGHTQRPGRRSIWRARKLGTAHPETSGGPSLITRSYTRRLHGRRRGRIVSETGARFTGPRPFQSLHRARGPIGVLLTEGSRARGTGASPAAGPLHRDRAAARRGPTGFARRFPGGSD